MIDLFTVYTCPNHGDVLEDHIHKLEEIDTENDDVYVHYVHDECGMDVTPKMVDGAPCFETVDHERWLWANGHYDDDPDEPERAGEW